MRSPFLTCAIALSLAAGWTSPVRADDGAAALLAKHKAYMGWQFGDGTIRTLRIVAHVTKNGNAGERPLRTITTLEAGAIYRRTAGGLTDSDSGYTGRVFWESDANGFTRPDYSPLQGYSIARYALFNEGTTELTGTLEGSRSVDGTSYSVVRVQPANGDAIDLYINPVTGTYARAVIDPGGSYETTFDILGYTDVLPGKRYIGRYRTDGGDVVTLTKIQPNVAVDSADFHPPQQQATWTFADPQPFHVDVKPGEIILNASVNGVPGRFVFDTGADGILLSDQFADRAHLTTMSNSRGYGIGPDSFTMRVRRAASLTIGGNTLSNVIVGTTGLDEPLGDERVDGLIGFPLLAGAVVNLKTSDQTMTISDPATTPVDQSSGAAIRVDLSGGRPVVPMTIDHRVTVNALLDMGDGSTVVMSPQLVTKRHIPMMASSNAMLSSADEDPTAVADYIQSHIYVRGLGGVEEEKCSTVSSIALGPIDYQGTYACTSQSISGDNIIVGYHFLKNFDYIFDYHDGLIILKPHPQ